MDEFDLFNSSQHGFRSGRSCLRQLLSHFVKILSYLEQGINVDTVYLDFSKAFDKVDHGILLDKLKSIGIGGKVAKWIFSFLHDRKQVVIVNGMKSKCAHVLSGVPQGFVLGPSVSNHDDGYRRRPKVLLPIAITVKSKYLKYDWLIIYGKIWWYLQNSLFLMGNYAIPVNENDSGRND